MPLALARPSPFASLLENELHVIYSLRLRDILYAILVRHVGRARAGVDRRPLEATSEDESSAELRDAVTGGFRHKALDGSRSESLWQSRDLLHHGVSPIRASVLRGGRFRSRAHAGAQAHGEISGSRRQTLRRGVQRGGKSQDQQYAAGVRGRQVRARAHQRQRYTHEGGHSAGYGESYDG